jgi:hypothetical protein
VRRVLQFLSREIQLMQDTPTMGEQAPAMIGRCHTAAVTMQQVFLDIQLKPADLTTQYRLRDAEHCRGFGEAAEFRHADETFQLPEIHALNKYPIIGQWRPMTNAGGGKSVLRIQHNRRL